MACTYHSPGGLPRKRSEKHGEEWIAEMRAKAFNPDYLKHACSVISEKIAWAIVRERRGL